MRKFGVLLLVLIMIASSYSIALAVKPGDTEFLMFSTGVGGLASVVITILVTDGLEIVNVSSTQSLYIGYKSESALQLYSLGIANIMTLVVEVKVKDGVTEDQKIIMKQDYGIQWLTVGDSVAQVVIESQEPAPEATPEPTPEPAPALKGDATNDGSIDILDLVSIIDHIVSGAEPASKTNADANGDGTVDILDLVWIIDQIVGGS